MDVNKDEISSTPKKNLSITYIRISACVILLLFLFFVKSFKPIFYDEIKNWYECNLTVSNYDVITAFPKQANEKELIHHKRSKL